MSRQIAEARNQDARGTTSEPRPRRAARAHPRGRARTRPPGRNGGDLVVETLAGLGATTVFGLPGQHALGMFDALRRSVLRYVGLRVENNAGFAADAYGRITGEAAPLLLSTGPGALTSLAALQEAAAASAPVLAISSQIPTAGLGGGRHGYLHELPDQQASFRDVVKSVHTVRTRLADPVRDRRRLGVRADGPARPGVGGDPAGRAARRDDPARRSRRWTPPRASCRRAPN